MSLNNHSTENFICIVCQENVVTDELFHCNDCIKNPPIFCTGCNEVTEGNIPFKNKTCKSCGVILSLCVNCLKIDSCGGCLNESE